MEALAILKILLILVLLGSTIYSVIVYQSRKKASLKTLATFRQETTPQRNLDAAEHRLLGKIIAQAESKTLGELTSNEVYPLSGPYLRHGLETNGNTVWHDTIGGVEVLLPYDADYFLREHNDALVVLAEKQAIVIALNDDFSLAEGEEREQRREQKQNQWESGEYGELSRVFNADDNETEDDRSDSLTIREQRQESDAEMEARHGRGAALLPAFLWTIVFVCLAISLAADTTLVLTICLSVSLLAALFALYQFFRHPSPGEPLKVNQVYGQIRLTPVGVDEHNNVQISVTLNESIGFNLPDHWRPFITYEDGQNQEMAIRVDDYSVVSYGNRMSLDQEVRRFPPVYWGRHLTLAIVGAIALLFPLSDASQTVDDVLFTGHWLGGTGMVTFQDPGALLKQPPSPGTLISLNGNGHCAVDTDSHYPAFNCRHLYWGADAPQANPQAPPPVIKQLQDRDLLLTEKDRYLSLIATMQGWNTYRDGSPVMFSNLPAIIDALDAACGPDDVSPDISHQCQRTQRFILERLAFTLDSNPEQWPALREQVMARQDSDEPVTAVTSETLARSLRKRIHQLVDTLNAERSIPIAQEIAGSQQGGVLIQVEQGRLPPALETLSGYDRYAMLGGLLTMIDNPEGEPFQLEGMVTAYQNDDGSSPVLSLDLTRNRDTAKESLINVLWLLLASGLLLGHGLLAVIRFLQSRKRDEAISAFYA
ncbi:MAG: IgaA/UmoB family intracellular growth attenuator [Alcanivorax sp.]|uniref:IgaA/UmoB family intracellular growth attenuator n=1 Tax=Alcanivorax sp. TaxID=1872427 RepID=UPI003DA716B7